MDALPGARPAVDAAASFRAASRRSGSLVPSRVSGSINSSVASAGSGLRGPVPVGVAPEDADVAPADTLPSMGASTGRSVSGSKTGRDAASIVSGLVNASSNANRRPTGTALTHSSSHRSAWASIH